jgi:hypothetical protein
MIKKSRFIFGIDDGSGVVNCIMWPDKGFESGRSNANELKEFFDQRMKVGTQVSIIGYLEYYNGEI